MPAAALAELTDEELADQVGAAQRAPAKAHAALSAITDRHGPALVAFLASSVGMDVAEDLVQDVWLQAWRSITTGAWKRQHLRGWLFQVARSRMIDHVRKMKPSLFGSEEPDLASREDAPPEAALIAERQAALERCMEGLSPEEAGVVRARLGGNNYDELCRSVGIEQNKAYGVLSTAKKKLQRCLHSYQEEI